MSAVLKDTRVPLIISVLDQSAITDHSRNLSAFGVEMCSENTCPNTILN